MGMVVGNGQTTLKKYCLNFMWNGGRDKETPHLIRWQKAIDFESFFDRLSLMALSRIKLSQIVIV